MPDTRERFRRWFWRPPRAHGEVIPDRRVSALELLYDLVYVAVISQAAHHLGELDGSHYRSYPSSYHE